MLHHDAAKLRVLYLGGSGTISASCAHLSAEAGMRVTVLNRGRNTQERLLPEGAESVRADVVDDAQLSAALGDRTFDAVVNFLSYDTDDARRMVAFFGPRTRQYIHISSGSIYAKPVRQVPISESTPTAPNPHLPYATAKWRAEQTLLDAHVHEGFPLTIVRPSHTYDDANPPLPGGWSVVDRIARGEEIPVHGDGTSLWTLTHAEDFAQGLVGLLGNPRAIGETFNITGPEVYTWDQIYTIIADALGVTPRLVHVASEMYPLVAPDWFWSGEMLGDIGHSAVFDTTKIRTFVPGYAPRLTFHRAATRMIAWRDAHPESTRGDAETDAVLARIVDAYHDARKAFAARAPEKVAL
ncbi:NAD-dependent epimerase/dehydratase family protein [Actinoplanes sp. TBRC 11911]|uniref:NAD-dependent epimerase/dehydratase family protein n=1 Tax=Actinoplanes sp. TBRC 11911 TaxID=2729386 RepID=UPI00145E1650|nr:NAD-dependent epimerase/dehydratase family protein [Actinoplanes sp. TBRC 11911]NMO49900.1 NAD-dependent epimerase/dehydratase family protein [Actinoplanes sp. TBRC 11911]